MIRQFALGKQAAGAYLTKERAAYWDGHDQNGEAVSSGVYFYRLDAGNYSETRKMAITK